MFRLDPEDQECPAPGPQEIMIQLEETQKSKNIWNLARNLKPREYEVLWLRYAEDLSVKDIAKAMKKTQIGIRTLLHRSRLRLGRKLRSPARSPGLAETVPADRKFSVL